MTNKKQIITAAKEAGFTRYGTENWLAYNAHIDRFYTIAFDAGATSRDAEIAELHAEIKGLKEADAFLMKQMERDTAEIANTNNRIEELEELIEFRENVRKLDDIAFGKLRREKEDLQADNERLSGALENCRLLAARSRKESWALLILGFCAEGGVIGSVTRDNSDHHGPDWTERDGEYLK